MRAGTLAHQHNFSHKARSVAPLREVLCPFHTIREPFILTLQRQLCGIGPECAPFVREGASDKKVCLQRSASMRFALTMQIALGHACVYDYSSYLSRLSSFSCGSNFLRFGPRHAPHYAPLTLIDGDNHPDRLVLVEADVHT